MNVRIFKKTLGLLVADIVIIIGIFILQFRTDSTILEKLGNLQITLNQNEESTDGFALRNKLSASYNGISLHCDENNSAKAILKGEKKPVEIQLVNYEKNEEKNNITFMFTQDIKLILSLASDEPDAGLTIDTLLPSNVTDFYLPYNFAYNMKIQQDEGNRVILNNKNSVWDFKTDKIEDGFIHFSHKGSVAHYAIYDDTTKKFTFDSITSLAIAEEQPYLSTVAEFKENLINSFKASISDSSFTEASAVAYVAAMAEKGAYQQGLDDIPSSYKKSTNRTYLSAPFFNNLAKMDPTLDKAVKEMNDKIASAAASGSLDIYTTKNLAAGLFVSGNSANTIKIINSAVNADISQATIPQVTGIVRTYLEMLEFNTDYAKALEPVMEACMEKITASCSYTNDVLTISENDTFLSVVQAIETGIAVMRYGYSCGNQTYIKAGRVLVNSYMAESSSFDLRTLTNLYPIIAYDNWYYPHIKKIRSTANNTMWAWTCARDIKFTKNADTDYTITIDFPETYIHYVILKGIPQFEKIYIYNMAFRTDPRFETYNSSGYVYKGPTSTLLLKSRHKSRMEDVRMELDFSIDGEIPKYVEPEKKPKTEPKPQETTEKPAETTTTDSSKPADSATTSEKPAAETPKTEASAEKTATPPATTETAAAETPATPEPVPAPKPAPAKPVEKHYTVILEKAPAFAGQKNKLKKYIAETTGNTNDNIFNEVPATIKSGLKEAEADELIAKVEEFGGKAYKKVE